MLKIIACICFLIGSCGFGYIKVLEYRKRYEELIYIRYILNLLFLELQNRRGTFGENCLAVSMKIKEPYASVFNGLYELLERERKKTPEIYWNEKTNELSEQVLLKKEETRILQGVIRCANGTTPAMPLEVLQESMLEWDKVVAAAEQVRKEKSKVTVCLSVTAGLLLCITII